MVVSDEDQALILAAEKGNLAIVELMLKNGAEVDQASLEGVTPLMAASYAGAAPVVQRLLAAGAKSGDVDCTAMAPPSARC